MRVYLVALGVILCAVYAHSESRQYYPGVGYVSTGNRAPVQTSSRLRAAPAVRNVQRPRAARLRDEYELIEREELSPSRRRSRPVSRNNNRRSVRRNSPGRRYRLARNEATTIAPPASEPVAIPAQPSSSSSSSSSSPSFGSSPVQAFGGIFPNFQGSGGLGGVTGGGYAQTNGPGAAFAAGFAQSSGSNSFAGGFGAVINHPRFPQIGGNKPINTRDADLDGSTSSSKDDARSDDPGFDDPIDEDAERWFNKTSAYVYDLSSTVMTIKNWTESAVVDIGVNTSKRVTDQLTFVPLKEMIMMSNGKGWKVKCNKCPSALVYVMTNGLEGKMFTGKSFTPRAFKFNKKLNQQPQQTTESPTSTIPPITTTTLSPIDNPLIQ